MRFGYSWLRSRFAGISKQVTVVVGLIICPITMRLEKVAHAKPVSKPAKQPQAFFTKPDPRTLRLSRFLAKLHCPVLPLSEDFVRAADDNQLDWRLLPSISVVESGGGKTSRNNNIFGWDNGSVPFPTIRAGINLVAYRLGKSPLYQSRDVVSKLHIYNPDESYADSVVDVMNQISPVVNLSPARRIVKRQNEFVYVSD